ncbi:nicotinate-nicotinamide nucleotide adenylyltransferase [Tepidibacter thalassicus]|uniref:nicotinate-nucleotide adenylyltransferase n=1 Tax=Tepidibacter thalassicus DSM 15285 TaxID=1123350 RepID=A0A1M5PGV7_9FIRM|nr:cytidyltransferase [Tepidibacter thalassicus]SHH01002.1 Nicotinic acid mononucleotide adenylyltransferase [Tepidibacter thalassicus DSM 15285]
MRNKIAIDIHKKILKELLKPTFIKKFQLSESFIKNNIDNYIFIANIHKIVKKNDYSCKSIFLLCENILNQMYKGLNQNEWLIYIYNIALYKSFPDAVEIDVNSIPQNIKNACHIYLKILKIICEYEKISNSSSFYIKYPLNFLTNDEINNLENPSEYKKFIKAFKDEYIYEMMKLNQEILKHNTLDHICGVHHLAVYIARQLKFIGIPVDLGRVSGSAAGHDLGKFGCKKSESKKVPYLHYYYTDQWFKKHNITYIGHIALNHSVWDLELENLSLESLILIYCDFRVKNKKDENNNISMHIFSLKESFKVILEKLDNLNSEKEKRYTRVYYKLKDFENYLIHIGINLNYNEEKKINNKEKAYYSLITGNDIVKNIKYLSVHHNINLMYKLRNEHSLNFILELARSENDGKNIREYLQVFEEYSTYLTQNQKIIMLKFLYEQLIHPEDDIRRQCAELIGTLIAIFDEDYRKEIPENVTLNPPRITSCNLLNKYLNIFINPDHKIIDIHQKWIGYSIRIMISSLFSNSNKTQIDDYKKVLFNHYKKAFHKKNSIKLYLLHTAKYIPVSENDDILFDFILKMIKSENDNLRISALDTAYNLILKINKNSNFIKNLKNHFKNNILKSTIPAENFLNLKIIKALDLKKELIDKYIEFYNNDESKIANIFLSNLKTLTPWIIKKTNIDLLLEYTLKNSNNMAYTAMHFCNILKVSDIEYVRNTAGKAIIKIMPHLSPEQRNDIAIELLRSLEIEKYQFSKYIPYYLGKIILYLQPLELNELINDLIEKIKQSSVQLNSLLLKTIGITIEHYPKYKNRFSEENKAYTERLVKLLGILLNGLAHYDPQIKKIAFKVIGKEIFGSKILSLDEKKYIFKLIAKKILILLDSIEEKDIIFLTNAAALNHIYRFISNYTFFNSNLLIEIPKKIAFFPGTFDPFSLSHKQIAKAIQSLGFEVYLAVDEFSWSKKAQPNLFRRNIINMSIADELNIYLYPKDIPVNIANPNDLKKLRENFPKSDIYIVIGSDVILNASAYEKEKTNNSIHTFHHIIFDRKSINSTDDDSKKLKCKLNKLEKKPIILNLPPQYEDISSSQIRQYIDQNRDISKLIDPLAQKYIYEKGLYQREPQYKTLIKSISINIEVIKNINQKLIEEICNIFSNKDENSLNNLIKLLNKKDSKILLIRDLNENNKILGFCVFHTLLWSMLFKEFKNTFVSEYIRKNVVGKAVIIDIIFTLDKSKIENIEQIIITEVLTHCIEKNYTYAIYKNDITNCFYSLHEILELQGFYRLPYTEESNPIFIVNMTKPCVLTLDVESVIKNPFVNNLNVKKAIINSRKKLQKALTDLYPKNVVLSFDRNIIYENLIRKICEENKVPNIPLNPRVLGDLICVPFGNLLKDVVVPNTITKSLHTEKLFTPNAKDFSIASYPHYLDLKSQVKTISSFDKPIILVDDILNKGYRIKALDPILKEENINVKKIIVGILSGRGKELMDIQNRDVDSVYFIPNLRLWFNENAMYPFIGGDTLWRGICPNRNLIPSINLIFPYTSLSFVKDSSKQSLYNLSKVCIENSINILETLEHEYEKINQRKLTLNHIGEVFKSPRYVDRGKNMSYDLNLNPSHYLKNDLELLNRMKDIII